MPIFALPHVPSKIRFILRPKLRASSALLNELAATQVITAPTSKVGHIVKGPYQGHIFWQPGKKGSIIEKVSDPMKLNQVAAGSLLGNIVIKHGAVIAEECALVRGTLIVATNCLCNGSTSRSSKQSNG
jgi:hypothetical protein